MQHLHNALVAALVLGLAPIAAHAGGTTNTDSQIVNPTGACNGALPAYEGGIRKRPLAMVNEGTGSAFVSCSLGDTGMRDTGFHRALMTIINRGTVSRNVSCTLVTGAVTELSAAFPELTPASYPKTVTLAPGAATIAVWDAADYSLQEMGILANFNCNLPPKVELAAFGVQYDF